jgi:hypothetical protein
VDLAVLANHLLVLCRDVRSGVVPLSIGGLLSIADSYIDTEFCCSVKERLDIGVGGDADRRVWLVLKVGS